MRASEHPHSQKRQQKGPSRAPDGLKRAEVAERAAHGGPARVTRLPAENIQGVRDDAIKFATARVASLLHQRLPGHGGAAARYLAPLLRGEATAELGRRSRFWRAQEAE